MTGMPMPHSLVPTTMQDGWAISTPADVGLDGERFRAAVDWLDRLPNQNLHSLLVARHGALAFEHYRKGTDGDGRHWPPDAQHGVAARHGLRSATKSVTGLLAGIALERKHLPGLDARVLDYFPEYADLHTPEKERITVRHLLTMSAGLDWDENVPITDPRHGEMRMWRTADHLRVALEPAVVAAPGVVWNYSGGCSELLGAILRKATGQPLDAFARETLFAPLGIDDVVWLPHADGSPSASGGLHLRSRDLAKIGQLVVARGQWNGRTIVPARWIEASIAPQIGAPDRLFFYGYHWWLGRSLIERKELTWASAVGFGGQRLYVLPSLDLVVAVTAGHYADAMQAWLPLVVLNRFVLPAVRA
jgi:CubicO group peptidase (beta-lactamase class C family)